MCVKLTPLCPLSVSVHTSLCVQLTPPCPHGFLDTSHVLLTEKFEAKICCAADALLLLPELGLHQGMALAVQQKGFSGTQTPVCCKRLTGFCPNLL